MITSTVLLFFFFCALEKNCQLKRVSFLRFYVGVVTQWQEEITVLFTGIVLLVVSGVHTQNLNAETSSYTLANLNKRSISCRFLLRVLFHGKVYVKAIINADTFMLCYRFFLLETRNHKTSIFLPEQST